MNRRIFRHLKLEIAFAIPALNDRQEKQTIQHDMGNTVVKTHHYIIFFVQPLHSKLGMESFCSSSTDQLSW